MRVGYIRVSSIEQNLARQQEAMAEAGVEELYQEKASGKNVDERPELQKALKYVHKGDTLVVASLDRLSRNYDDIKELVNQFHKKKVTLEVLDAPFLKFNTGNETMDKAMFDMFLSMLSYTADMERRKIKERQKQGIAIAKQNGVYKGKQNEYSANAKDTNKRAIYKNIVNELKAGNPIARIARENEVNRKVVYRIKNEIESEKEA